jgi:hypothetical protein
MRSYSHLSEDERDQIGVLRAAGRSMGAIARATGRSYCASYCAGLQAQLSGAESRAKPQAPSWTATTTLWSPRPSSGDFVLFIEPRPIQWR